MNQSSIRVSVLVLDGEQGRPHLGWVGEWEMVQDVALGHFHLGWVGEMEQVLDEVQGVAHRLKKAMVRKGLWWFQGLATDQVLVLVGVLEN